MVLDPSPPPLKVRRSGELGRVYKSLLWGKSHVYMCKRTHQRDLYTYTKNPMKETYRLEGWVNWVECISLSYGKRALYMCKRNRQRDLYTYTKNPIREIYRLEGWVNWTLCIRIFDFLNMYIGFFEYIYRVL